MSCIPDDLFEEYKKQVEKSVKMVMNKMGNLSLLEIQTISAAFSAANNIM